MELKIDDIDLLLPKKVPKHGKVSGIRSERDLVRVIIPKENTKLSLIVYEPSEVLVRHVTADGKILGLTNFVGKTIYILDQQKDNLLKEANLTPIELGEGGNKIFQKLFEYCEKKNIDPTDFLSDAIKDLLKKEGLIESNKGEGNE